MRRKDIIALILLAVFAIGGQILKSPDPVPDDPINPRRPAPQIQSDQPWDAQTRAWLSKSPTRSQNVAPDWAGIPQTSVIEIPTERGSGSGTAFAVGPGAWLTARHVVDGCDVLGLLVRDRKGIKITSVEHHPHADVSLVKTKGSPQAFGFGSQPSNGDDGYMIGFPKGQPGGVHGRKIGTTTLKERGRYKTRELADVWSERSRVPDRFDSLGGLSGGPVFSDDGRFVGVVLAEERRRGRVITAQTATVRTMFQRASVTPETTNTASRLSTNGYPAVARDLLTSLRIAKVICRVR